MKVGNSGGGGTHHKELGGSKSSGKIGGGGSGGRSRRSRVLSEMVADHFAPSGKWRPQIWEFKLGLAGISFLQNLLPIGLFFYYNILFPPLMQCLIP